MSVYEVEILKNEYWYGGAVNDGYLYPLSQEDHYSVDLRKNATYNQINPLYVSSKGRYIWLENAGRILFDQGKIIIEAEKFELDSSSKTLKEAQQKAAHKFFPSNGKIPAEIAFKAPQICSWIALDYQQNQEGILSYATSYIKAGYKPGIIILDDTWQRDYGVWEFDANNFPDPKKLVEKLHELGFKVVLWVAPYVSADSPSFRELKEKDAFLRKENGEFLFADWWNGYSVVLDFSKESAKNWFELQIARLKEKYSIDGFKLDGGDAQFLQGGDYPNANIHNTLWCNAIDYDVDNSILEFRACYKMGGTNIIARLADKAHRWGVEWVSDEELPDKGYLKYGLSTLVPNILTQGLTGYYYGCPDMVGGGFYGDFVNKKLDDELLIRWCQCSTFMPMVQFSYPLWNESNEVIRSAMKDALTVRETCIDYIITLAQAASRTGEPIVRYMEYEFPQQGFEKVTSQFLLGDKYLIAPIIEKGQKEKTVYFPKGTVWQSISDGKTYDGCSYTFSVDINTILAFKKI